MASETTTARALDYIRSYYGVDPHSGQRVIAYGKPGEIVGAEGQYLRLLIDGENEPSIWHPTWNMEYLPAAVPVSPGAEEPNA